MRKLVSCILAGSTLLLFSGCDEKKIGQGEVVVGKAMQTVGDIIIVRSPHPVGKAAGAGVYGAGVLVEEDGRERIRNATQP